MPRTATKTMSAAEVAELYGVTEHALRRWRYEGKGPSFYRVSRTSKVRYDVSSVQKFLRECLVTPGEKGK